MEEAFHILMWAQFYSISRTMRPLEMGFDAKLACRTKSTGWARHRFELI